jgi:hypothetical protein
MHDRSARPPLRTAIPAIVNPSIEYAVFIASSSATPSLTTRAARRENYLLACEGIRSVAVDRNSYSRVLAMLHAH